jgi:rod shape-determining protein MreC
VHDTRRTRWVLGVLLVAALALITIDYRDGSAGPLSGLRSFGGSVFGGAERAVSAVTGPVTGLWRSAAGSGSSSQVSALQNQVLRLRAELSQAQLSKADYRQLSQLLQLSGRGGYRIVAASVIAIGQGYAQTVTLDAGSRDGVRAQETVLDGQGLVGTVTSVSPQTCTVLLATDATSVVGVRMAGSGQIGWVTGQGAAKSGGPLLRLQVLNATAGLSPGQQLVTSASVHNRPYVSGVPVGVISKVQNRAGSLTALALVRPYADFGALGVVGIVIAPPRHDPRYSVLPPSPQARPTPTVTVTVTPRASASSTPGVRTAPAAPAGHAAPAGYAAPAVNPSPTAGG